MARNIRLRKMVIAAMTTALLCVIAPFAFPVGPVPVTMTTLLLLLFAFLLGVKWSVVSCAVYLFLGVAGVPVFSGFAGGIGVLLGPTGGYLLGYLVLLLVAGPFLRRQRPWPLLGCTLGIAACYLVGTAWYCVQTGAAVWTALTVCVVPFLPADALKIAAAVTLGPLLKNRLHSAGVL